MWPKCSLLWKFGLDIPLDGVLVTVFVSQSFSCFNHLNLGNTISMATGIVSFDLVSTRFQKKLFLLTLNKAIVTGGFFTRLAIVAVSAAVFHLRIITIIGSA